MNVALISVSGRLPTDGSRLISALLKRAGHRVRNVYLARTEPEYGPEEIARLDEVLGASDLVMLAVYSNYSSRAELITERVHAKYPGLNVVWGGPHCVSVPQLCLRHADAVCFSEGDEAVTRLVGRIASGEEYRDTPNFAFRDGGRTVVNDVLPPYRDLDSLPFYDYGSDDQLLLDGDLQPLSRETTREQLRQYPFYVPLLYFLTSRGCPYVCSYCNNCRYVAMFGRNVIRFYSVDRIIAELKHSLAALDFVEFIGFGDDDFFARPQREIEELAERYRKEIGLPFGLAASALTYRRSKLEPLLEAGLKAFNVGVQSGSQRVIDEVYDRRISLARTREVVDEIAPYRESHHLSIILDFIIDNPYETRADVLRTYRYLLNLPARVKPNLFFLSFFPGTPIYERAVRDGIIRPFGEGQFRSYTRAGVRYQKNYETFLVLLLRIAKIHPALRKIPKVLFKALASWPMRAAASLLPRTFWRRACDVLQIQKAWRKKTPRSSTGRAGCRRASGEGGTLRAGNADR